MFLGLTIFATFFAFGQKPLVYKTTELNKYAPKEKTNPPTTIISRRFDKIGREILAMSYYDDDTLDVYIYEYDRSGNLIGNTSMLVAHDKRREKKYRLVRYEKSILEYNEIDQLQKKRTYRKVTSEQYHEAMNKLLALLKQQ